MSRTPSPIWIWRIITDGYQDSSVVRNPCRGVAQDRNRRGPRGFDQRAGRGLRRQPPVDQRRPQRAGLPVGRYGEPDRKSVVEGKSVSVRLDLGGARNIKKKKT